MKKMFYETIRETGRRGELEQDKLFCLLLDMQENIRQDLAENPDYRRTLELERLQAVTNAFRRHLREGRDILDQLTGWLQRVENSEDREEENSSETEYPMNTLYHLAVAEQEKDLQQLYPSKFGME